MKFQDYKIEILDEPEKTINGDAREKFIDDFTAIAQDAFGKPGIPTREDVKNHILPGINTLVLAKDGDSGIGFGTTTSFELNSHPIVELVGVAVMQKYQRAGLGSFLISAPLVIEQQKITGWSRGGHFMSRTQSPVIYKALNDMYPFLQPEIERPVPTELCEDVGNAVLACYGRSSFNRDTFVFPRAYWDETERKRCESCGIKYDAAMYADIPRSSSMETNAWMDGLLDYRAGDAMIIFGPASAGALHTALHNICVRGSPGNLGELKSALFFYKPACQ
jgi:hypothetical protein